jgi:hypothetical protein
VGQVAAEPLVYLVLHMVQALEAQQRLAKATLGAVDLMPMKVAVFLE